MRIIAERDARKQPVAKDGLRELFKGRRRLLAGKGKQHAAHALSGLTAAELETLVLGPTGNLRAPTLLVGDAVVVGFTEAMYREVMGG
jgi:hypothetical protein